MVTISAFTHTQLVGFIHKAICTVCKFMSQTPNWTCDFPVWHPKSILKTQWVTWIWAHRTFKCMGTNFTFTCTDAREQTVKGSSCAAKDRTGEETQHSWSSALCIKSDWMNLLWKFKAEIRPAEKQGSQFEVVLLGVSALKSVDKSFEFWKDVWVWSYTCLVTLQWVHFYIEKSVDSETTDCWIKRDSEGNISSVF